MRQRLENYLYKIWYSDKKAPWFLRFLSVVFNSVRKLRIAMFNSGILSSIKIDKPVIVVGNISVGGTGKTPLVLFLVDLLKQAGLNVGVISRGYGGTISSIKNSTTIITAEHTAKEVGDEPYMIHALTQVPFAIGKDKVMVAQALLDKFPEIDVLISDDGLQHYKLQRNIEMVVVDGERGFGNCNLLPAGPLREPLTRLKSIDILFTNGDEIHSSIKDIENFTFELNPVNFMGLNNSSICDLNGFIGKTVHAFAGIGNPERFFNNLRKLKITVISHELGDHGYMPDSFFNQYADDIILMTQKDAVKYPHIQSDNIWYMPVKLVMSDDTKSKVLELIQNKITDRSI